MAFECATLMHTLAAWASTHLSLREPKFSGMALQHRNAALRHLQTELESMTISREMWLAVTMSLCSMEIIADGTQCWYEHLVGGATALGLCFDGEDLQLNDLGDLASSDGKWLLRNFAYHDILMSVSTDRRPLLSGSYWLDQDDQKADPYFGLAAQIVYLIGEISALNADLAAAQDVDAVSSDQSLDQSSTTAELSKKAKSIESKLFAWRISDNFHGTTLAQLAETYRDGAFLHLYRTLRRHVPGFESVLGVKIRKHIESICVGVRDMPVGCLPECTLLFPLFMAGGEAEEFSHIAVIREKMRTINQCRRFQNVEVCLQILDELWRMRISNATGENGHRLDWLDIIRSKGIKLAIT